MRVRVRVRVAVPLLPSLRFSVRHRVRVHKLLTKNHVVHSPSMIFGTLEYAMFEMGSAKFWKKYRCAWWSWRRTRPG